MAFDEGPSVQLNSTTEPRITINNNKTFQITQTQRYINSKIETLRTKVCKYMMHNIYIYIYIPA